MIRIGMLVFSYFPADTRVRREAEALTEKGMKVDVICLRNNNESKYEMVRGVKIYRIDIKKKRGSKLNYIAQYIYFTICAFIKLTGLHIKNKYHIVHVHNMPDILVGCAIFPKLNGSKIVLDLHDPMPELYMAKYSVAYSHPVVRLIKLIEKMSIKFSDLVFTPNISFKNLFVSRSCPPKKIEIIMNSPQENVFNLKKKFDQLTFKNADEQFIVMYHGTIVERSGLDIAIKAIASIKDRIKNVVLHVYGSGDEKYLRSTINLVKELSLNGHVRFFGRVSSEEIARAIESAHLGVVPNRLNAFTNLNFPVRIFEYLIMGKPVIVPITQGILDYFDTDSILYFEAGNSEALGKEIANAINDAKHLNTIYLKGKKVFKQYRWIEQKEKLINLMESLAQN